MQVQVRTDNHIKADESLLRRVEAGVDASLGRFGDRITRVEVHLNDVNGPKAIGDDKRCLMEARLAGHQPIIVSHQAPTLDEAIDGAAEKLERLLDSTLERLNDPKGRTSYGGDQTL